MLSSLPQANLYTRRQKKTVRNAVICYQYEIVRLLQQDASRGEDFIESFTVQQGPL